MTIELYIQYLDRMFETICDTRMFLIGTKIKIKSIDIRQIAGKVKIRFRCIKVGKEKAADIYLDAREFIEGIGFAIKEIF